MPTFTTQRPAGIAESFASLMQGNRGLSQSDMLKADNMISEVESHRATASHNNALAEKVRLEIEAAREGARMRADPAMATEYGARNAGIALPEANAVERNFRGEQVELAGPPNVNVGESSMPTGAVPIPTNVNPQQVGIYNAARAALLGNQLATGKTNAAELAKAGGEIQGQGIAGAVQTAIANGDVQGASAMNQGAKPGTAIKLFDNVGNTGATFAPATGTVNAAPGTNALLDSTLANVKAQTGQHNAQANNANASAETHRARTGAIKGGTGEDGESSNAAQAFQSATGSKLSTLPAAQRLVWIQNHAAGMSAEENIAALGKAGPGKPLPPSAAGKIFENQQNLRRAEQALALIEGKNVLDDDGKVIAKGDKDATGMKGFLPDQLLQRTDEKGNATRAAIADLGSLIIHDRSGAAVTASEFPRLAPFIPTAKDSPEVAKTKLTRFVNEYRKVVGEMGDFYKESGYNVPTGKLRDAGVEKPAAAADANPAAAIQDTKVVKGVTYVKVGGKWYKQ